MANNSTIEWTEATWNPATGCSKVTEGCDNCYAEVMARRLKAMRNPNYRNGFEVTVHPHMLDRPKQWKRPRMIFTNSMSDLFHQEIPHDFIQQVFDVMTSCSQHTFQVLTKRSGRLNKLAPEIEWPENVWMGVTVENERTVHRIDRLRSVPASIRFLSCEPLLGPLPNLDLTNIDWVIVGGESGPRSRPMNAEWVKEIRDQCVNQNVPFFFKQWGGTRKKKSGRSLDGKTWEQWPA